jgi:hypothetical protein
MASNKRRQLERLLHEIAAYEEDPIMHTRGLANLLASGPKPDDDADADYSEYEGMPGLAGLLHYLPPQTERPYSDVTG